MEINIENTHQKENKDLKKGKIIIISGPSGCGKSSIIQSILSRNKDILFSISYTTRSPRPNEKDGEHYHFISQEDMKTKINNGEMIEHVEIFNNIYGTSGNDIIKAINNNYHIICDVEECGCDMIQSFANNQNFNCITIWIDVDKHEIINRIIKRGSDIDARVASISDDYSTTKIKYDFLVKNHSIPHAVEEIENILFYK